MGHDIDAGLETSADSTAPVWAVFGDLMAGLLGAFVLILVARWADSSQLSANLRAPPRMGLSSVKPLTISI